MHSIYIRLKAHLLDIAIAVVLAATLFTLAKPLRDEWARGRLDANAARTVDREWAALASESSPLSGSSSNADVLELSDYECPFCRRASSSVDSAIAAGAHIGYLQYPLRIHPHAEGAAIAALCSEPSGKFKTFHERLMTTMQWQQDTDWVREAKAAGVADLQAFEACLKGSEIRHRLDRIRKLADSVGVHGTPMFVARTGIHRGLASNAEILDLARRK